MKKGIKSNKTIISNSNLSSKKTDSKLLLNFIGYFYSYLYVLYLNHVKILNLSIPFR